jgi:hypothetical protein
MYFAVCCVLLPPSRIVHGLYNPIQQLPIVFFVYLCIRFAHISYGQFIAIRYKFKLSTYILEPLVVGGVEYRERFKRENG